MAGRRQAPGNKQGYGRLPYNAGTEGREIKAFSERTPRHVADAQERTWNPYGRQNVMRQLDDISYDDWNPNSLGFIVRSRP